MIKSDSVKRYATNKNVSQWRIAEKIGVSEATIQRKLRHDFISEDEAKNFFHVIDEIVQAREATEEEGNKRHG